MTRSSLHAIAVLCGLALVLGPACMKCGEGIAEKAVEKAVEQATGGKVDIDAGSGVDLSGLPGYLQYPGAKATGRFSIASGDGSGATYSFETPNDRAAVVGWFKSSLAGQSWKETMAMETDESTVLTYGSADEKSFTSVVVGTGDGKTTIAVTLGSKK
ncbi:MAG: hypothetical protein R6X12_08620 [bacterium]